MARRALIIAIEEYPRATELNLTGPMKAAEEFEKWLLEKWDAEEKAGGKKMEKVITFCSSPIRQGGRGAATDDVLEACEEIRTASRAGTGTDEFFVFFSGHGFAFGGQAGSEKADFMLMSDYKKTGGAPRACLNVQKTMRWFADYLGVGHHTWIVDACRNELTISNVSPADLEWDGPRAEDSDTFLLQSVPSGNVAGETSWFFPALLAGLNGNGTAKNWVFPVLDAMVVNCSSLAAYLREAAESEPRPKYNPGTAAAHVLKTIVPVPEHRFRVVVEDGDSAILAKVAIKGPHDAGARVIPFTGTSFEVAVKPGDYLVSLEINDADVEPTVAQPVRLYADAEVRFRRVPRSVSDAFESTEPTVEEKVAAAQLEDVDIVLPANAELELIRLDDDQQIVASLRGSTSLRLNAGRYTAVLRDARSAYIGTVLRKQVIEVRGGGTRGARQRIAPADWTGSVAHESIAGKLPGKGGAVDFSKSLYGEVPDDDLDLWLALLGAGRILGAQGDYEKIAKFPLSDFSALLPDGAAVYVLAGFSDRGMKLEAAISESATVEWEETERPGISMGSVTGGGTGIRDRLLSLRLNGAEPQTIASAAARNRVTLMTVTIDEEGGLNIAQYLLPAGHLVPHLPEAVREKLIDRNQLKDVGGMVRATALFRSRRRLEMEFQENPWLHELFLQKWLEPNSSCLAAYEVLRRGKAGAAKTNRIMEEVVQNMKAYYPELPDTWALAALAGENVEPRGAPLFIDGLRAFPNQEKWLPLPGSHLDYTGPWTAWRMAVSS